MRSSTHRRVCVIVAAGAVAAVLLTSGIGAQASDHNSGGPGEARGTADSADVARTVHSYHAALERGDSTAAIALLTSDAVILESGGMESTAEYRAHHLPADIAFARAVNQVRSAIAVTVRGEVAWAVSTSTAQGTFRDREVDSVGAELMVLERTPDGWRIAAIHWSSRRRG